MRFIKKLPDGKYLFCCEGTYFTLTKEQADFAVKTILEER